MPKRIKPYNNLGGQDVSRQSKKGLALPQQNANQPNKKHFHHHADKRNFGANPPGDRKYSCLKSNPASMTGLLFAAQEGGN
jgi:hypothetical protein